MYIRGIAQVGWFVEARLGWFGHVRRKYYDGYICRRMLRMKLPGNRKRERPKRRFMGVVRKDMTVAEMREEDEEEKTE